MFYLPIGHTRRVDKPKASDSYRRIKDLNVRSEPQKREKYGYYYASMIDFKMQNISLYLY